MFAAGHFHCLLFASHDSCNDDIFTRSKPVYLVDYHCYKAADRCVESLLKCWWRISEIALVNTERAAECCFVKCRHSRSLTVAYLNPCSLKMPMERFRSLSRASGAFTEQSLDFQERIIERSGLGD